jgi:hypothetical protein
MVPEHELGSAGQVRMAALLPDLLAALRRRRRRAQVRRAMVVAVLAVLPGVGWLLTMRAPSGQVPVEPASLIATKATMVHDDPSILVRCEVRDVVRQEWWLSDAGLQATLRAVDRPDGLVCVAGRVFVAIAAIDPFPTISP